MKEPISRAAIAHAKARDEAGYMNGRDLLGDLRGDNGTAMRSVAIGYVMALHDALDEGTASGSLTLEGAVASVETWLAANASMLDAPAAQLVQSALRQTLAGAIAPVAGPRRIFSHANRRLARTAGAVALCVAGGLAGWALNGIQTAPANSVALGRSAASIARLVLEERRYEKDLFINIQDRDRVDAYASKWRQARDSLNDALDAAQQLDLAESDRRTLRGIAADFDAYVTGYENVLARIRRGEIQTAQEANDAFARYKAAAHRIEASSMSIAERTAATI